MGENVKSLRLLDLTAYKTKYLDIFMNINQFYSI